MVDVLVKIRYYSEKDMSNIKNAYLNNKNYDLQKKLTGKSFFVRSGYKVLIENTRKCFKTRLRRDKHSYAFKSRNRMSVVSKIKKNRGT
jgi:hypothetical protein